MLMSGGVNVDRGAETRSPGWQSMSCFGFYLESGGEPLISFQSESKIIIFAFQDNLFVLWKQHL